MMNSIEMKEDKPEEFGNDYEESGDMYLMQLYRHYTDVIRNSRRLKIPTVPTEYFKQLKIDPEDIDML